MTLPLYTRRTWVFGFLWERHLAAIHRVRRRSRQDAAPTTEPVPHRNRKLKGIGYNRKWISTIKLCVLFYYNNKCIHALRNYL